MFEHGHTIPSSLSVSRVGVPPRATQGALRSSEGPATAGICDRFKAGATKMAHCLRQKIGTSKEGVGFCLLDCPLMITLSHEAVGTGFHQACRRRGRTRGRGAFEGPRSSLLGVWSMNDRFTTEANFDERSLSREANQPHLRPLVPSAYNRTARHNS